MEKGRRLCLKDGDDTFYYELDKDGRAFQNALIKERIYGADGVMLHSDYGWQLMTLDQDIYEKEDYSRGELKASGTLPRIPAGAQIIVNESGKVKKSGSIKIDDVTYEVEDYKAVAR